MINVSEITYEVRSEGYNTGLPMTVLRLGMGDEYDKTEDLVQKVMSFMRPNGWLFIDAEEEFPVGLGQLIKDLRACRVRTELRCSGDIKNPGWYAQVERWCVNYVAGGLFNYFGLRNQDMVKLEPPPGLTVDITWVEDTLKYLEVFTGLRFIKLTSEPPNKEQLVMAVSKFSRTRIYIG